VSGGVACDPGTACTPVTYNARASMCTTGCTSDAQCPLDSRGARGVCENFGDGGVCFEQCSTINDCLSGWTCELLTDNARVCLP
jgi:hypothetical protein